jgi:hypothetical protein
MQEKFLIPQIDASQLLTDHNKVCVCFSDFSIGFN